MTSRDPVKSLIEAVERALRGNKEVIDLLQDYPCRAWRGQLELNFNAGRLENAQLAKINIIR